MLRGFATVSYFAADLEAARKWYSELLGIDPYFQMPGYVEFRVGDYQHELGIIDASYAPPVPDGSAGEIIHWHVDDLPGSFEKLLSMGATEYQPPTDRSEGFVTGSVVDPFGNILGIMCNPHYLEVLKKVSGK
ncbi:VOC family protein [Cryobacterium sp. M15]|uniref:VOC family protein n=1 Tax=Cryobacterium sp. M15 TaxID=2048291 RepID=UPI000CE49288|nr:VOC family protein [Cryobacterium sp. M15]